MEELHLSHKVEICGIPYLVVEKEDVFDATAAHYGQVDFLNCVITINKNMAPELKNQTVCHEMVHAILTNLGYSEQSDDEQFVQALASAINQSFVIKVYPA